MTHFEAYGVAVTRKLTLRESAIANCLLHGMTDREIALEVRLSHGAVGQAVSAMLHEFGARNRHHLCAALALLKQQS